MAIALEQARRAWRDFELLVPLDLRGMAHGLQQTFTAIIRLLYTVAGVLAGGTQVRSVGPCRVPAPGAEPTPGMAGLWRAAGQGWGARSELSVIIRRLECLV